MTPRTTSQRPTAKHTPPQALGWRYAAGRTRNLRINGSEGVALSLGARTRMPPGTCDALATPVTYISVGERKHLPKRAGVDRSRYEEMLPS